MKCFMDLHSSMDRFKGNGVKSFNHSISIYIPVWIDLKFFINFSVILYKNIYIPVWIDLKRDIAFYDIFLNNHLHSSMDRFKVRFQIHSCSRTAIYIPVWIDLKADFISLYAPLHVFTFQYG